MEGASKKCQGGQHTLHFGMQVHHIQLFNISMRQIPYSPCYSDSTASDIVMRNMASSILAPASNGTAKTPYVQLSLPPPLYLFSARDARYDAEDPG